MALPRSMLGKSKIGPFSSGFGSLAVKVLLMMLLSLSLVQTVEAQIFTRRLKDRFTNLADYDRQRFHFGFSLGINNTSFIVKRIPDLHTLDSVYTVEPRSQLGFNLGIISDMRMGTMFNLRFIPMLSFTDRYLDYGLYGSDTLIQPQKVESTFLQFPLSIKFKSIRPRDGNWRAYVLAGGNVIYDLASQAKIEEKQGEVILKLKKFDYSYEVGIGFDFYLQYFKLAPEIKVSFGLNNQLVNDGTIFTESISSLTTRTILFSLNFE